MQSAMSTDQLELKQKAVTKTETSPQAVDSIPLSDACVKRK